MVAVSRLTLVSLFICSTSLLFGYNLTALNPVIDDVPKGSIHWQIPLSSRQQELATAALILGATIGSMISGAVGDRLGLRVAVVWNNWLFIIGAILTCAPSEVWTLYLGRLLCGFGVGIGGTLAPVLISDLAPEPLRGRLTTLHQLGITIGILLAALVGYAFVEHMGEGWRVVLGFVGCVGVFQLIVSAHIPESPRWLLSKRVGPGQDGVQRAREILLYLRAAEGQKPDDPALRESVEQELVEIQQQKENSLQFLKEAGADDSGNVPWSEVWKYWRPVTFGLLLTMFMPLSGINVVTFYSAKIFGYAGVDDKLLATLIVTIVNMLATVFAMGVVDNLGRRTLLRWSAALCLVGLTFMGVILLSLNSDETTQGYLAIAGCLVFIIGFAIGLGAVMWITLKELLPVHIISKAYSLFMMQNWAWNLIISLFTLTWIEGLGDGDDKLGAALLFLILAAISLGCVVFTMVWLPETKNMNEASQRKLWGDEFVDRLAGVQGDAGAVASINGDGSSSGGAGGMEQLVDVEDPALLSASVGDAEGSPRAEAEQQEQEEAAAVVMLDPFGVSQQQPEVEVEQAEQEADPLAAAEVAQPQPVEEALAQQEEQAAVAAEDPFAAAVEVAQPEPEVQQVRPEEPVVVDPFAVQPEQQ